MSQAALRSATPQRPRLGPGLALPRASGYHALPHLGLFLRHGPCFSASLTLNGSASHRQPPAAACCCYPAVLLPARPPAAALH